mmetsp:Transcript_21366/g.25958  ORF Transcript_21366/g.25958 Transcript_21366/m.25958 type:complete len:216 (-) Transcript_21366:413-1060(-)
MFAKQAIRRVNSVALSKAVRSNGVGSKGVLFPLLNCFDLDESSKMWTRFSSRYSTTTETEIKRDDTSRHNKIHDILKEYKRKSYTDFTTSISVRWIDQDAMGHVNNAKYFSYFEVCRAEFFDQQNIECTSNVQEAPILAETSCSYKMPVMFPDRLFIGSRAEKSGEDSWIQEYLIVSEKTCRVVAHGTAKLVNYDYVKNAKAPFSDEMIKKLKLR